MVRVRDNVLVVFSTSRINLPPQSPDQVSTEIPTKISVDLPSIFISCFHRSPCFPGFQYRPGKTIFNFLRHEPFNFWPRLLDILKALNKKRTQGPVAGLNTCFADSSSRMSSEV